jgi:hypothetical protein
MMSFLLLIGLLLLWIGYTAYNRARRNEVCFILARTLDAPVDSEVQIDNAFAAAHGCKPPAKLETGRWPLGLELVVKAFRVAGEQRLLRLMSQIVKETGTTFEQNLLGARGIDTIEPANIEALLSTQFTGEQNAKVKFPSPC